MPTDTIYGVVGQALNKKTVERIYTARKRMPSKPMIILISSVNDLRLFGIEKRKSTCHGHPKGVLAWLIFGRKNKHNTSLPR